MLQPGEFEFISGLLKQHLGLVLTADKEYLLESRLLPIARARNLADISALIAELRKPSRPADMLNEVVEAMTTNESLFFRDAKPFEQLKAVLLPALRKEAEARKSLRIWSAACSTGQEPYSVAITLLEENIPGWRYEIVATDIAQKVLDKAQTGVYSQFEAQRGLSIQMLMKYFQPQPDTSWKLKENVRGMVNFRQQNLLTDFGALGKLDLIMCRNVFIYFDDETKAGIVERMAKLLNPKGILMIGATETLVQKSGSFEAMNDVRGAYRLK